MDGQMRMGNVLACAKGTTGNKFFHKGIGKDGRARFVVNATVVWFQLTPHGGVGK